jgi:hypothetical protein
VNKPAADGKVPAAGVAISRLRTAVRNVVAVIGEDTVAAML